MWANGNYFGGQYPRPSHQFLLPARDNQGFILHTAPQSGLYGDGEYLPDEQFSQYILDDPEGTEHDDGDNSRRFLNHDPTMPTNPIAPAADAAFGESFGFGVAPFLDVWSSNFNGSAQNFQSDNNFFIIPGQNLNGQRPLAINTHSMHGQYTGVDDGDQQSEGSYKKMRAPGQPTNIIPTPKMDRKTLKRLRNRVSASRCRIKKKVWIQDMETKANSLEQQRVHYFTRLNKLQEAIQYCHQALSMQGNISCPGSPISSQWSVSSHHHIELQHPTKRGPVSAAASSLMLMGLESSQKRHSLMGEGDDKGLSSIDVSHFLTTNPAPSVSVTKKIQQQ